MKNLSLLFFTHMALLLAAVQAATPAGPNTIDMLDDMNPFSAFASTALPKFAESVTTAFLTKRQQRKHKHHSTPLVAFATATPIRKVTSSAKTSHDA